MLFLPGSPGFVQFRFGCESYGYGFVLVSRPGYGRTPLSSGKTGPEQAELIFALMDHLKIDKFFVYAGSGGGPIALQMCLQQPERLYCCLLACAVTGSLTHHMKTDKKIQDDTRMMMTSVTANRMMPWYMVNQTESAMREGFKEESKYDEKQLDEAVKFAMSDEYSVTTFRGMADVMAVPACYPGTFDGILNDLDMYEVKIPFEKITVPTLILHGDLDGDVVYS